jgi:hypothetical protein
MHTKGPWEMSGDIVIGPMYQPPNPKADKTAHVICKLGWDFDGDCNPTGDLPWAIAEENARLIAAAPELLEACEFALEWLNGIRRIDPTVMENGQPPYAGLDLIRKAIAKATA